MSSPWPHSPRFVPDWCIRDGDKCLAILPSNGAFDMLVNGQDFLRNGAFDMLVNGPVVSSPPPPEGGSVTERRPTEKTPSHPGAAAWSNVLRLVSRRVATGGATGPPATEKYHAD